MLRDGETFSSTINAEHIGQFMGDLILAMDGAEHRQYRNLVAKAFRASQLEQWDDTLVRPTINRLLDDDRAARSRRSRRDVTSKYPVQVICGIVGVPLEDAAQFHAVGRADQHRSARSPSRARGIRRRWSTTCGRWSKRAARSRSGDFLSDLVHAEVDGEQLSDSKIYGFLRLLLPAGAETTFRVMGNCLYALARPTPTTSLRVVADRSLLPEVIEETLRWETSVTMVSRVADAGHRGRRVPDPGRLAGRRAHGFGEPRRGRAGTTRTSGGSAGRRSTTSRSAPVSTSASGMHLARLELRVGLDTILDRLPNLRLDPDADLDQMVIEGYAFRGPRSLPVLFDASVDAGARAESAQVDRDR